jgi:S1-C subfamily serine protease
MSKKFWLVIMIIGVGLVAGVAGELLVRFYLFKDLYSAPYGNEVNLTDSNFNKTNLVIQDPKKVVVNSDVKITETINSVGSSWLGIFKKQVPDKDTDTLSRNDYYDFNQAIFSGLALTSDGWLMANVPTGYALPDLKNDYIAISRDKKIYQIDQILDDRRDGWLFIHLADTKNLVARNLAAASDMAVGQMVLNINWSGEALPTSIVSLKNSDKLIKSTDVINEELVLASTLSDNFKNSYLFNLGGDLVGVVNEQKVVKSIANYRALVLNVLKNRTLATPTLGVSYLDLSSTVKNEIGRYGETLKQNGALIYPDATKVAVVKGSPADLVGLQAGDVVLTVDGVELNESNDLAELVQNSLIGDILVIKYSRAGTVKEVEIKLEKKK